MQKLRLQRKNNGLCVYCGKLKDREGIYCSICNKALNILKKQYSINSHKDNKCSNCGKLTIGEAWFCPSCLENYKINARIRNAFRRANNLCVQCGNDSVDFIYCQRCRDMTKARRNQNKNRKEKIKMLSSKEIENILLEQLKQLQAPLVTINKIKGIKQIDGKIIISSLRVNMGKCTGNEFEAIKTMRQQVEIMNGILISGIIVDL